jgi:hypothetical protein
VRRGEGANEGERRAPERSRGFILTYGLGLWWVASDVVGCRGRRLRAALWSESRGLVGGVGGWPVWLQWRQF